MFVDYYKYAIQSKENEVRLGLLYNLPCYYFTFKNDEAIKEYFDQNYYDLSLESDPQILKLVAVGVHEALGIIQNNSSIGIFKDTLKNLLNNSDKKDVREALVSNIDKIIEAYDKELDLKSIIESI